MYIVSQAALCPFTWLSEDKLLLLEEGSTFLVDDLFLDMFLFCNFTCSKYICVY